jgi:hypothetical protein
VTRDKLRKNLAVLLDLFSKYGAHDVGLKEKYFLVFAKYDIPQKSRNMWSSLNSLHGTNIFAKNNTRNAHYFRFLA